MTSNTFRQREADIRTLGESRNPTASTLGRMNLAIRSIEGNHGIEPVDSFHRDLHKDLTADYILANPPFNMSDWGGRPPARRRPLEIRHAACRQRQLRLGATFPSSPLTHDVADSSSPTRACLPAIPA